MLLLLSVMWGSSCKKEFVAVDTSSPDFINALVTKDNARIKTEMEKILLGLTAVPDASDDLGQSGNVDIAVQRLNAYAGISAELVCYACIKTNPPQSEIKVVIDATQVTRILDISTSSTLTYVGVHE